MAEQSASDSPVSATEALGRAAVRSLSGISRGMAELGYATSLFLQSLYFLVLGRFRHQPVRFPSVIDQMMEIGIRALPIATILSLMIGVTLAMQGIDLLRTFGAESQVVLAVALSISREFAPLIMGILVAGRSGSALAARLGTMVISQEIDALRVMGINPVRYLVVPPMVALVFLLPLLTFWADLMGLLGGALYTRLELGMSFQAYADATIEALTVDHLMHGIGKSAIFAVLITLVAVVNGLAVSGGAEQVGRATTRTVVLSIAGIIVTDMLFIFVLTRG
jgi:phospholipid/cholesterol/gamma-HCH transport system permease protein